MANNQISGTMMLIGGLELLRHAISARETKNERRTTYTEREIYDPNTQRIITLRTRSVTYTERN